MHTKVAKVTEFNYTDDEFIIVMNHIFKEEDMPLITDINSIINIEEFDSLDTITVFGWLSELFGIEPELDLIIDIFTNDATISDIKTMIAREANKNFVFTDLKNYNICL